MRTVKIECRLLLVVVCECAVVYSIEPLTLNQRVPGSIPVRTPALLSFSKALYPHCCSPPRCINGYPVGCERYCWLSWHCARPLLKSGDWPECSPGSRESALSVQNWLIPMTGVIVDCEAHWNSYQVWNALYKNQLLYLLFLSEI